MCQVPEKFSLCGVLNYFIQEVIDSAGTWPRAFLILEKEELQVIRSCWCELKQQRQFVPFASGCAAKSGTACPVPASSSRWGY